ncbi:unnamed protein product [Dovyalis caffra]|uniref:Uncharacterized protein n=1 Tax=Dovyalis caffra TaxID=77055 RepID=A0AAV1RFX1_9ROSI|nr:unnamed protein product [Dovyalis caffra]
MGFLPESFMPTHMQWSLDVFINILSSALGYALEFSWTPSSPTPLSSLPVKFQSKPGWDGQRRLRSN